MAFLAPPKVLLIDVGIILDYPVILIMVSKCRARDKLFDVERLHP